MALKFSSPQIDRASKRIVPCKFNGGGEVVMRDLSFTTFSLSKRTWTSLKVSHPPSKKGKNFKLIHFLLKKEKVVKKKSLITTSPPPLNFLGKIFFLPLSILSLENLKSNF